jgi:hypothetical protein
VRVFFLAKTFLGLRYVTQVVEYLPSYDKAQCSSPNTAPSNKKRGKRKRFKLPQTGV